MTSEPVSITTVPDEHEADHRSEVYFENDVLVIRASGFGGCIRNLVAARMGIKAVPFNDTALTRMNEGNIHEPHILRALEKEGWEFITTQEELELPIAGGRIIIRGHSDGRARHASSRLGERTVEAKAMGHNVWAKWKKYSWSEFRRYAWQVSHYMHATGLPAVFAAKNRDTGEVDVTLWDEAPISLAEMKLRAIKIAAATELPECDPVQFPCNRFFIHTGSVYEIDPITGLEVKRGGARPAPEEVPEQFTAAFEELARAYEEAREECARAEAKRKEVSNSLLSLLGQLSLQRGKTSTWSATEVKRTDRRLDQKSLRAKYPEAAEEFTVESTTRYVKVTRLIEEEEG